MLAFFSIPLTGADAFEDCLLSTVEFEGDSFKLSISLWTAFALCENMRENRFAIFGLGVF